MVRLGLIGYSLEHSLSPQMHGAALYTLGISGEYRLYPVPPLPEGAKLLKRMIASMRAGELRGLNVTIPHKQAVMSYLDDLTERARAIGAVNTIFRRAGEVVGDNTDAPGFAQDLQVQLQGGGSAPLDLPGGRLALVIGAGGAARAVIYALHTQGWRVAAAARRVEQAQALAANFSAAAAGGAQSVSALPLERSSLAGLAPGLIVNASSAGMFPAVETTPWLPGLPFPPGAFVYDLVYNPSQTALMSAARGAGLRACNGLGMLVEQAALALETWLGCIAPRNAMRAAISRAAEDRPPDSSTPTGGAQWK